MRVDEGGGRRRRGGGERRLRALAAALLVALFALPGAGASAEEKAPGGGDPGKALAGSGWTEEAPGLFAALPPRSYEIAGGGLSGEFLLEPGRAVVLRNRGEWKTGTGSELVLELRSDGVNPSSDEYGRHSACFPVSVTAVFGSDAQPITFGKRVKDFFYNLFRGFPPGGIRLTYAIASTVPAGSMYRPEDAETVFVLGGRDDAGRTVAARRSLGDDFRAAYGRDPKGPVTGLVVRACRPKGEPGALKAAFRLVYAAP